MKKFSLIIASFLMTGNLLADNSLESAFKAGTLQGDITLYGEKVNNDSGDDSGFTSGSIGLEYATGEFYGLKASIGFRSNHDFSEVTKGDYAEDDKTILHTANISYANKYFELTAGRQEVDLEWMSDYHEGAMLNITSIADTNIVIGYSNKIATADADAPLEKFEKFDSKKNIYVADVKYEGVKGLVLNPYYYDADNLASWYGLKADYDTDKFGITIHGAKSDSEIDSNDGEILHFEGRTEFVGLGLSAGYITTDKNSGAMYMDTAGDNINPLEEGEQIYSADADTTYVGLVYELSGIEFGAIYGHTKYANEKEKELNLTASYEIRDGLSLELLYLDVNRDENNSNPDYNKIALTLAYSF